MEDVSANVFLDVAVEFLVETHMLKSVYDREFISDILLPFNSAFLLISWIFLFPITDLRL